MDLRVNKIKNSIRLIIGMPVYNGEKFLKTSVESLLSQTFTNFELIISDDFSKDSTKQICEEFAAKDDRIRYIRQPKNIGITENFNYLLQFATAPYFMWAAQDDLWEKAYIEKCILALQENPCAVFCSPKTIFISEDGETSAQYDFDFTTRGMGQVKRIMHYLKNTTLGSLFYGLIRRSALEDKTLENILGQDFLLMFELLLKGDIILLNEYLFKKRLGGASDSLLKNAASYRLKPGFKVRWHWAYLFSRYIVKTVSTQNLGFSVKVKLVLLLSLTYLKRFFYSDLTFQKPFRRAKKLFNIRNLKNSSRHALARKGTFLFIIPVYRLWRRFSKSLGR